MTEQNRMEDIIRVTADVAYVKSCIGIQVVAKRIVKQTAGNH